MKKVFISYSHDSVEHRERVLALSERLRKDGIETILDQYINGAPEQGWPRWMLDQLDAAEFVLVVCTNTYYRRFRGHEESGKGVDWEGAIITQELYDSRSRTLKFVPVFLSADAADWCPEPLRPLTHYTLTSEGAYQDLYDFLLGQAGVEPGPVGTPKTKARRKGTALNFGPSPLNAVAKIDISRIDKYAPAELIGREAETDILNNTWAKVHDGSCPRPHILTFIALGGEGKTSLIAKWVADLAGQGWPGCEAAFAWSFYSQGSRDQAAVSSDIFLQEALTFFGAADLAASAASAYEKGKALAQLVGKLRSLLILDGLEPLQYAPSSPTPGELKDNGLVALLKGLAAINQGLCIVTTRYSIPDLRAYRQSTAPEHQLLRLSRQAGVALLQRLGVHGSLRKTVASAGGETVNELEKLVEDVKGHALTLNLIGTYLRDAHGGDIRKRDLVRLADADAEEQGGHAFRVMDAYVRWFETGGKNGGKDVKGRRALAILRLLGFFDRPATADCLDALWQAPPIPGLTEELAGMSEAERNIALRRLEEARLLTVSRDATGTLLALDTHPLLRDYFAQKLRRGGEGGGQVGNGATFREGHRRLYQYLAATTKEGDQPSLEDLQPLYQAVAHGCQAGLQQEACDKVYHDRILRGQDFYSTKKLGAFGSDLGAVACFFDSPWDRVSLALTLRDQAWLLNGASTRLRALGRLTEALAPMRVSGEMDIKVEEWNGAARSYNNLSELDLNLGDLAGAVADADQSVTYADRSGEAFMRVVCRTTHANALHQAGRLDETEVRFREAEAMQAEDHPDYPLLYSLRGFQYCDLLLTTAERGAWQVMLPQGKSLDHQLPASCRAVEQRAAKTLEWVTTQNLLLDIALDHLTLSRTALYLAILEHTDLHPPLSDLSSINAAVSGLRRAGQQQYFPPGLLTRAWLRSLTGQAIGPDSAQSDLDEAWEIAERGSMKLHQIDILLYRARLFGGPRLTTCGGRYPWQSAAADLALARTLIKKHGYLRRKEELEDAEDAMCHWLKMTGSATAKQPTPPKIANLEKPGPSPSIATRIAQTVHHIRGM